MSYQVQGDYFELDMDVEEMKGGDGAGPIVITNPLPGRLECQRGGHQQLHYRVRI